MATRLRRSDHLGRFQRYGSTCRAALPLSSERARTSVQRASLGNAFRSERSWKDYRRTFAERSSSLPAACGLVSSRRLFSWSRWKQPRSAMSLGADGRAKAGASIPTRAGRKCAVVSRHDVVERRRSLRGIDLGLDKPGALSVLLIVQCDEPRPKRGNGAGATDDQALAIDANLVAGHRVGVSANIGNTSAAGTYRRRRHIGVRLPGRQRRRRCSLRLRSRPRRWPARSTPPPT